MGVRERTPSRHGSATTRVRVSAIGRSAAPGSFLRAGVVALFAPGPSGRLGTVARLVGAALVGTMGGIHLDLWFQGYRSAPTIGPLFLVNAGSALVVMVALATWPRRFAGLAGTALLAGTLAGYLVSVFHGLFGFHDTFSAPLAIPAMGVELAGFVVLGCWTVAACWRPVHGERSPA